jgi:hypothetical protein
MSGNSRQRPCPTPKSLKGHGQWFDLAKRTLSSTSTTASTTSTTSYLHIVRPLSPNCPLGFLLTPSQELFCYSFTTAMFTRILIAAPRVVVVKRTLATLPSASSPASRIGPRLSTTNTVSVISSHHDSPFLSESTLHHASYSNALGEQASKGPYMVDGGVSGGFGGIPMGAFAASTPFEQH